MGVWNRVLAAWLIFVCCAQRSHAVERDELMAIIESSYNLEPGSEQSIERIIEQRPDHPLGYFLKGARLYWLQYYAGYDEELSDSFVDCAKESLDIAKRYYSKNEDDEDALFFLGMIELNFARYYVDERRWFSAFLKARSGMKKMRRLLELNPNYHDAKQPFGIANCYLDDVPGFMKAFARFFRFRGNYKIGLKQLHEAKLLGCFTRYESALYIADVSWQIKKDAAAAKVELEWLVERFPRNVFFQFNLAVIDRQLEENAAAIERLESVIQMPQLKAFIELYVGSHLQLGHFVNERGEAEQALAYADEAMAVLRNESKTVRPLLSLAQLFRARVLRDLGRKKEALALFRKIEKSPYPAVYQDAQKEIEKLREDDV